MKKMLIVTLVISLVSAFFMVLYFLMSTDIYHDYVSTKALIHLDMVKNIEQLPIWAIGESLWKGLQIDFLIRIVFMVFITVVMLKLAGDKKLASNHIVVMLVLIFISFGSMFIYFLASTDIFHDYISKQALITSQMNYQVVLNYDVRDLPAWTECSGEWALLTIDLAIRCLFMIFTIITLLALIQKFKKQEIVSVAASATQSL